MSIQKFHVTKYGSGVVIASITFKVVICWEGEEDIAGLQKAGYVEQ